MENLLLSGLLEYQVHLYKFDLLLYFFINKVPEGSLWTGFIHFRSRAYFLCISELVMIINFFVPTINHSWLQLGRSSVLLISSSVHIILHLEASTNHPSMGKVFFLQGFCRWFYHLHLGLIELSCLSLTLSALLHKIFSRNNLQSVVDNLYYIVIIILLLPS